MIYVMKHKEYVEEYSSGFRGSNNLNTFQSATWKDIPHINMYDYPSFEPSEHNEIEPHTDPPPPPTQIYTSMPSSICYPSSRPTENRYSYSPSKPSGIYSYAPISGLYNSLPPLNIDTTCPTTCPTYSSIPTYNPNNNSINTTTIDYSNYENYNTAIFGIATGLGSCCFCIIFLYIYKIYSSKKNKLQKIQKNSLASGHEYSSLQDIRMADYNSVF